MAWYPNCVLWCGQIVIFAEFFRIDSFKRLLFEEFLISSQSLLKFVNRVFFFAKIVSLLIKSPDKLAMDIKCLFLDVLQVPAGAILSLFPIVLSKIHFLACLMV